MVINKDSFVHIEKGISIYIIEYILLYHYGYFYSNSDDPHQDTQHNITDISDGQFHFSLYGHTKGKKYIAEIGNPETIGNDYFFNGVEYPVIKGSKLLRNYKLNKIKKQIKNKKSCTH
jgi:hypothetical protein